VFQVPENIVASYPPGTAKWVLTTLTALRVVGFSFLLALPQFLSIKKFVFSSGHILREMHAFFIVKNKVF
jgi:hypothetical protein